MEIMLPAFVILLNFRCVTHWCTCNAIELLNPSVAITKGQSAKVTECGAENLEKLVKRVIKFRRDSSF
jgi:hypothetical protein